MNPGKLYIVKTAHWVVFPSLNVFGTVLSLGVISCRELMGDVVRSCNYWEAIFHCKLCFLAPTDSFVFLEEEDHELGRVFKILTSDGTIGWIVDLGSANTFTSACALMHDERAEQ